MADNMLNQVVHGVIYEVFRRQTEDPETDGSESSPATQKEKTSSFALFLLIMLLIVALFSSYFLQQRKIQAVHETVLSIFAGMLVGLSLSLTASSFIKSAVSFDYQFFFNLLLPPIILASGYELHQANFFRNIGSILTFAFVGTFISALVLGILLWLCTRLPLGLSITFVEAFAVGATLSATDPVTILAIFNTYKVDPKLYTVIFGESILNDAIAIVLFETASNYIADPSSSKEHAHLSIVTFFEAIGVFLLVFFGSLLIGIAIGIGTTLLLKFTHVRKVPKIESCLVILIAYASYFFATSISMSGIVTLLFCGITMKHYAYYNMSRRTQLTTKFVFQVLAQLSENFIFIYLGITLFTETKLKFNPLFILITVLGICVARWCAVFPLSQLINWVIRVKAKHTGAGDAAEELPHSYQVMLFWAGLRGAVGVALAAGFKGTPENTKTFQATVLVVVVLTVIIFGGTTARMLEIMEIRTGVTEEVDSDDEFDIETAANGTYYKRGGQAFGHVPTRNDLQVPLGRLNSNGHVGSWPDARDDGYASGSNKPSPNIRPASLKRSSTAGTQRDRNIHAESQGLLLSDGQGGTDDDFWSDSDLPPAAPRREPKVRPSPPPTSASMAPHIPSATSYPIEGRRDRTQSNPDPHLTASGAIRDLFIGNEDSAAWFHRLDEAIIKPTLLLDQNRQGGGGGGGSGSGGGAGHGRPSSGGGDQV